MRKTLWKNSYSFCVVCSFLDSECACQPQLHSPFPCFWPPALSLSALLDGLRDEMGLFLLSFSTQRMTGREKTI